MIPLDALGAWMEVRALFAVPQMTLVIDALMAGNAPGTVWVDDRHQPRTALFWDHGHTYYVAGAVPSGPGLAALERLVGEELRPRALATQRYGFKLSYSSTVWETAIPELFAGLPLSRGERYFYQFPLTQRLPEVPRLPIGFELLPIDESLLAQDQLHNIQHIRNEIALCWPSQRDFLQAGFGFCLSHGDELVSWCTGEYVSAERCGLGIETLATYQGRGLATVAASACVRHCLGRQLTPHWDSWQSNRASITVAEKLGFQKMVTYAVYFGKFNAPEEGAECATAD